MNRDTKYLEEKMRQFRVGEGFTIRVKDPAGVSVGGILFAKIGAVVLFRRLEAQGIHHLPIEMVSGF